MGGGKSKPQECGAETKQGESCRRIIQAGHRRIKTDVCFQYCWQHQTKEIKKWLATPPPLGHRLIFWFEPFHSRLDIWYGPSKTAEHNEIHFRLDWESKSAGKPFPEYLKRLGSKGGKEGQWMQRGVAELDAKLREAGFTIKNQVHPENEYWPERSERTYNLIFPANDTDLIVDLLLYLTQVFGQTLPLPFNPLD